MGAVLSRDPTITSGDDAAKVGKMSRPELIERASESGANVSELSPQQGWRLLQSWREVYCRPVFEATGKWVYDKAHAWNTFSGEFFPCTKGHEAIEAYRVESSENLLVLPEDDHEVAFRCTSDSPVDFSGLLIDVYVSPDSFEWTMVFTHEHPLYGPYYSRADWGARA